MPVKISTSSSARSSPRTRPNDAAALAARQAEIAAQHARARAQAARQAALAAQARADAARHAAAALEQEQSQRVTPHFDEAAWGAAKASVEANGLQTLATAANSSALKLQDAAIQAERTANRSALAANQPAPFADAEKITDVYEAARLDPTAQARLLGASIFISPADLGANDARKIALTATNDLEAAAQLLTRHLEDNPDPEYRAALAANVDQGVIARSVEQSVAHVLELPFAR